MRKPARSIAAPCWGLTPGENLFLAEGNRYDAYRPLNLQRGPFYTAGGDLAIDLDSSRIDAAGGEPVFSECGEPTPYLQSIMALMRELRPGLERTKVFVETLMKLKLVEPLTSTWASTTAPSAT